MQIRNDSVLITGGSSGIGLELARLLLERGNTVVIAGRDASKLQDAKSKLPKVIPVSGDVSSPESIAALYAVTLREAPAINVLINCAGIMRKIDLQASVSDLKDITREIDTNLNGTIWTTVQFLPHLKRQQRAAIVNVSSGLAFVPMPISPVYSATKAAIHAFTLSLRTQLTNTRIKVFELAPPGTDTPLFWEDFTKEDVGG